MAKIEEPSARVLGDLALTMEEVIADYRVAHQSRLASYAGRKEVMGGKAKFGIFGDGKEVAQVAMARSFRPGDFRSGYYRDQTFMLAAGMTTLQEWFAQLYADPDPEHDPASAGRQMNSHFSTRLLDESGRWRRLVDIKATSADLSPTGAQMPRLLGLAWASSLYRREPGMASIAGGFSRNGEEVAFGTIGNASTSEGMFFETMNAAGVLQVPMVLSVWDDEYGISVPNEYQTTHSSISRALRGFEFDPETGSGFDIYVVRGWEYPDLVRTYAKAAERARAEHIPALIHVVEMTQPQGHSTSGSHERYKTKERLAWENEFDCVARMRDWMLSESLISLEQLAEWEQEDRRLVEAARSDAWNDFGEPIREEQRHGLALIQAAAELAPEAPLNELIESLRNPLLLGRKTVQSALVRASLALRGEPAAREKLDAFLDEYRQTNTRRFNSHLISESAESPLRVEEVRPVYTEDSETAHGRLVLKRCFDQILARDPRTVIIGEDVGTIGDVNATLEGLQEKYGELRVTDTGIRETTILGQGIGAAMRGLRPIIEIQYLDYFLFCIQTASDDLATLQYRTAGGQKAPVVIRTRGHRLEGIWHTGSPMGMILNALRGVHICVPRNMVQAAGMYNTLLLGDDPGLVVEALSLYRTSERVPDNLGDFTVPLGAAEVIREGPDVTLVTYGYSCTLAMEAASLLESRGIGLEIVDVQTLAPFDLQGTIAGSLAKTGAIVCLDEDVPGGASAYMLQQTLETSGTWELLDSAPVTLAAKPNRSPYGTDGAYFSKPNVDDIVEAVYAIMSERDPARFP